jgi:hypothetical protein
MEGRFYELTRGAQDPVLKLATRPSAPLAGLMYVNYTDNAAQPQPGMPAHSAGHIACTTYGVHCICLGALLTVFLRSTSGSCMAVLCDSLVIWDANPAEGTSELTTEVNTITP